MQDRACYMGLVLREKVSTPWQRQRAEQAIRSVFGRLDSIENITAANSLATVGSMGKLVQVVANPSQLATQLTEFTADRSAAMVRQNGILQQCPDPVSGRGVA